MAYRTVRLGDFIEKVDHRNKDGRVVVSMSVSVAKVFKPTGKKVNKSELHNYKIVEPGQFAYVPTTGNEKRLCVALSNFDFDIVVTQVDIVFQVISNELLAEYLYMYLFRDEIDRYARFHSWGSAREVFSWDDICEIEIPLPPLEKQREYVAIYSNLQRLAGSHERSFADLQLISDTYMDELSAKHGTEQLGGYIRPTDTRNRDNSLGKKDLRGISTSKAFIQSKANTTGVNFASYKVVKPGQFAYVADTSRRGEKIALAYNDDKPYIISSIYTSFEIIDPTKLLPEFLLLWFKRPEFDRYARFNSWGSARETFDWSEMERVHVPVPPISVQQSIVAIYHALEQRKRLTERLRAITRDISPVLVKDAKDRVEIYSQS